MTLAKGDKMAEVKYEILLKPVREKLKDLEGRMVSAESSILLMKKNGTSENHEVIEKKEIKEQLALTNEKLRLMTQRVDEIERSVSPLHLEAKMQDVIDTVYKITNDLATHASEVKRLKEITYGVVQFDEMLAIYKMSGLTQQEIAGSLHMDVTRVSRILSGQLKKDDFKLYSEIKELSLKKLASA